jgi:hypothetical protein
VFSAIGLSSLTMSRMHLFEDQDSALTLEQGIAEYHKANPWLVKGRALSPEAQEFFRCHDAVHVVFGCGNTLDDEAVVKVSSILGTSAGFSVLRAYGLHESLDIYKKLPVRDILRSIVCSLVLVPRTMIRCLRQRRRWPWANFETYAGIPLRQIREDFGIRVAHFASK